MNYRKDYKTKQVSLYPYREAKVSKIMWVMGSIIIVLMTIILFLITPPVPVPLI